MKNLGAVDSNQAPACSEKPRVGMRIGQIYASREPAVLQAFLGSCVSVCLFDPVSRIGGMNHVLMAGPADPEGFFQDARNGAEAIEGLIDEMVRLGAERSRLVAKVFGGTDFLSDSRDGSSLGSRTVEFVLGYLVGEKIALLGSDTGGTATRAIDFHTDSFEITVRKIHESLVGFLLADEQEFRNRLEGKPGRKLRVRPPTEGKTTEDSTI